MNIKHILIFFLSSSLIITISCKENKTETTDVEKQMKKVLMIHDDVMPKMKHLGRLVGKLKSKIDTTKKGIANEKAMKDLQEANTSMMNWMHGFGDRFNSDEIMNGKKLTPQKKEWLNEEEKKIIAVKEKINSSIENAEILLSEL